MAASINDFRDGFTFTGGSASDNSNLQKFNLNGGRYAIGMTSGGNMGGGSVEFQILMPDKSTFVDCINPMTTDGSFAVADLPAGTYGVKITTATSVQMFCCTVKNRNV